MVTTRKIPSSAVVAVPMPVAPPAAPAKAKTALAIPAKLPARKKVALKTSAVQEVTLKQAAPAKVPSRSAPAQAEKPTVPEKTKKPKLVRDNFTIPKAEYAVIDALKQHAALLGRPVKKSELLRAGIKLLVSLPDAEFLAALAAVPALKTSRPVLEK